MARIVNALSFDVEEWFQAEVFADRFPPSRWDGMESRCEPQVERILELLAGKGVRATFFVLGWVAERRGAIVRRIAAAGHEVACHGYDHTMITKQSRPEFAKDLRKARSVLDPLAGKGMAGYRAPTFSITDSTRWALDVLWEEGFAYDASIYPIRHDRYGIPSAPRFPHVAVERNGRRLWEYPGFTRRFAGMTLPAAGGGYLRLFPYAWTRSAIRAAHREGMPAGVFAHPWEFDPGLPDVPLGRFSHWRHYGGIRRNPGKLARLLGEFRFAPVAEVLASLGGGTGSPAAPKPGICR